MIINLRGVDEIDCEQAGAIYDLTGDGNGGPPGFNTTTSIDVSLQSGSLAAEQGDLYAQFISGEWMTLDICDNCQNERFVTKNLFGARCPRCTSWKSSSMRKSVGKAMGEGWNW